MSTVKTNWARNEGKQRGISGDGRYSFSWMLFGVGAGNTFRMKKLNNKNF